MTHLRFAIIGWGYWGPKIARNLNALPHASVSMVADVDAVIIATPVRTHYQLAKEALLHGKHVLVEKPLTTCVAEAEELIALADQQQRVLTVGHTFLYSPAVNELRKMIQSGDLGKIYCVEAERVNLGLYRNDINVIWDLAPHDISILL